MARYIDADRLKRTFASGIRVYDGMCKIADVMHNIENEPTADVEEVVRCKDCKFCKIIEYDSGEATYHCKFCMSQSIPDDMVDDSLFDVGEFFCGLGKRNLSELETD